MSTFYICESVRNLLEDFIYDISHVRTVTVKYCGIRRPYGMLLRIKVIVLGETFFKTYFRIHDMKRLKVFETFLKSLEHFCTSA